MRLLPLLASICLALAVAFSAPPRVSATIAPRPVEGTAAAVAVPLKARAVDTSHPDRWVGSGTRRSCTSRAVVRAVAKGGIIRFRCGPDPVGIEMRRTAKVVNSSRRVVLDGRGLVTLDGGSKRRILYQNRTDLDHVTLRRPGDASSRGAEPGLRRRQRHRRHLRRRWRRRDLRSRRPAQDRRLDVHPQPLRPDGPGSRRRRRAGVVAAPRAPVYVVGSTFTKGVCSNGAALSSIGVSWSIFNSVFTGNRAIGRGANPARPDTSGGGSGGAVYADGNSFRLLIAGTRMTRNHAREGGGAVFFVSNDRSGILEIRSSTLRSNPSDGFETDPGIFFLGRDQIVADSVVK